MVLMVKNIIMMHQRLLLHGDSYTTGDAIGVAFDADNGILTFYKNGVSQGAAYTGLTSGPYSCYWWIKYVSPVNWTNAKVPPPMVSTTEYC